MGLEGVEKTSQRMMENLNRSLDLTALSFPSPDGFVELGNANLLKGFASLHLQAADYDGMDQMQLLVQVINLILVNFINGKQDFHYLQEKEN